MPVRVMPLTVPVPPTDVTVPVPAPMAVRKSVSDKEETLLSALNRGKRIAPGFVSLNKFIEYGRNTPKRWQNLYQ